MNDCIWSFMPVCYDVCKCDKYISANSETGMALLKVYESQVDKALEPLIDNWKRLFVNWEDEND